MKMVVHQLVEEIPNEQIATILQDLERMGQTHPEQPFRLTWQSGRARPRKPRVTIVATVGQTAAMHVVSRATRPGGTERINGTCREAVLQDPSGRRRSRRQIRLAREAPRARG